jgi:hypothetical protein
VTPWDSECFETVTFPELSNVITWFNIFSNDVVIWKFRFYIAECTWLITWRGFRISNCRSHSNLPIKTKHWNTDPVPACLVHDICFSRWLHVIHLRCWRQHFWTWSTVLACASRWRETILTCSATQLPQHLPMYVYSMNVWSFAVIRKLLCDFQLFIQGFLQVNHPMWYIQ